MAPKMANIVGPNGEEAEVLAASLGVYLRNGWTEAKEAPKPKPRTRGVARPTRKAPAKTTAARHDSAGTLKASGRNAKSSEE
jgi:hypothetical protein